MSDAWGPYADPTTVGPGYSGRGVAPPYGTKEYKEWRRQWREAQNNRRKYLRENSVLDRLQAGIVSLSVRGANLGRNWRAASTGVTPTYSSSGMMVSAGTAGTTNPFVGLASRLDRHLEQRRREGVGGGRRGQAQASGDTSSNFTDMVEAYLSRHQRPAQLRVGPDGRLQPNWITGESAVPYRDYGGMPVEELWMLASQGNEAAAARLRGRSAELEEAGYDMSMLDQMQEEFRAQRTAEYYESGDTFLGLSPEEDTGFGLPSVPRQPLFSVDSPDATMANSQSRAPLYRHSDPLRVLRGMSVEAVAKLQDDLASIGYDVAPDGRVNPGTIAALEAVMSYSNMNGLRYQESIMVLQRTARDMEEASRGRIAEQARREAEAAWALAQNQLNSDVYLAPDYETVSNTVKDMFRRELGRDPHDWEIDLLAEEMLTAHEASWEQITEIERQMELRNQAMRINYNFGLTTDNPNDGLDGPIDVPDAPEGRPEIDPAARFQTAWDSYVRPEREAAKTRADVADNQALLMGSLTGMDRLFGGVDEL